MSVTAIIKLKAKGGQGEALQKAFAGPLEKVRQHPICSYAEIFISAERTDEWMILEGWDSVEDHKKYAAEMKASGAMGTLVELMAGAPEFTYFVSVE